MAWCIHPWTGQVERIAIIKHERYAIYRMLLPNQPLVTSASIMSRSSESIILTNEPVKQDRRIFRSIGEDNQTLTLRAVSPKSRTRTWIGPQTIQGGHTRCPLTRIFHHGANEQNMSQKHGCSPRKFPGWIRERHERTVQQVRLAARSPETCVYSA